MVDASAGIKVLVNEDFSEEVQGWFERSVADSDDSLLVPDLFFIECANILWKKVRKGEYDQAAALEDIADLRTLHLSSTPTVDLMDSALQMALRFGITAYDACYVALAERNNIPMLTADKRLASALKDSACMVILLGTE
jgi:predicted nucleic acid-binding protein